MGDKELQRFIDNKSLVALKKFAKAEAKLKEMKAEHDTVVEQVKQAMIANGITKISGDWGLITLAERTNYALEPGVDIETIPAQYSKRVLDTTKVKAEATLSGRLPKGIAESKTQYIVKKFKEI